MPIERVILASNGFAKRGHAGHWSVLVVSGLHRVCQTLLQLWIAIEIRKALTQIDRAMLGREL